METGSSWFYNHERKASRQTWVSRDGNYKIEKGPADDLGPVQLFFGGQDTLFQQPTPRTQIPPIRWFHIHRQTVDILLQSPYPMVSYSQSVDILLQALNYLKTTHGSEYNVNAV